LSRDVVYFHNEQVIIDEEGKVISDKSLLSAVKARKDFVLSSSLLSKVEDGLGVCYYQLLPVLRGSVHLITSITALLQLRGRCLSRKTEAYGDSS
jgi:hypothetical protein